jgi:hypothetical protein
VFGFFGTGGILQTDVAAGLHDIDDARALIARYVGAYGLDGVKEYAFGDRRKRQLLQMASAEARLPTHTEGNGENKPGLTEIIDGYNTHQHYFTIAPLYRDVVQLLAGSGAGYVFSLDANPSGGAIDPATGAYSAGPTGAVTDVVRVKDSLGNYATANVLVTASLAITPASFSLPPRGARTFTASGGTRKGFTFALTTNASGGAIDPTTGVYLAGTTGNVTDQITLTDSRGGTVTATVTVTPAVSLSPAAPTLAPKDGLAFAATGGSGAGYTYAVTTNASGCNAIAVFITNRPRWLGSSIATTCAAA